jgi:transcriptional regulator with XRE-family HTH domain
LNSDPQSFSAEAFAARLRQIRKDTGLTGANIAQHGRITKQTFSGYLHTGRLPSAAVLANWVCRLGINANWLLTGEGPVMLDQASKGVADPVVRRVAVVVASMREAGAEESQILRSVRAMLDGELAKLERAQAHRQDEPSLRPEDPPRDTASGLPRFASRQALAGQDIFDQGNCLEE